MRTLIDEALKMIGDGCFSRGDRELFKPFIENLIHSDPYLVLADFDSYAASQDAVESLYARPDDWDRMSIMNVAHSGKFSSDRAIRDYAQEIWHLKPVSVSMNAR